MNKVATYKFYDKRGRRIGAIGEEVDGELKVFLLFCSRKDHFSKKKVRAEWLKWKNLETTDCHPVVFNIPLNGLASFALVEYMEKNYYRKTTSLLDTIVLQDFLYNEKEMAAFGKPEIFIGEDFGVI